MQVQAKDYLGLSEKTEKKFPEGMSLSKESVERVYGLGLASIRISMLMDLVKKEIIYGKPFDESAFERLLPGSQEGDLRKLNDTALTKEQAEMLHHAIGCMTEAGELLQAVFSNIFDGKPIDKTNLAEEIGDLCWYSAGMCRLLGTDFETEMGRNIAKLAERYPDKYSDEAALNRDLDAERKVLEGSEGHKPV